MAHEVVFDVGGQSGLALRKRFIHYHERLGDSIAFVQSEHLFEQIVAGAEHPAREVNAMAIAHLNCSLNAGHGFQM
jgi:hypothetical protein